MTPMRTTDGVRPVPPVRLLLLAAVVSFSVAAKTPTMKVVLKPYYLGGRLLIEADVAGVADRPGSQLWVRVIDERTGKTVATGRIRRGRAPLYDRGELSIKDLAAGHYRVEARLRDAAGQWLTKPVMGELHIPERPPWVDSRAGVSDAVPAPWTPLRVQGTTVACLGRQYRFTDFPFPSQIVSAGAEMLAEPIHIRVRTHGGLLKWRRGEVVVARVRPDIVELHSRSEGDSLSLSAVMTIEYDGLLKVDCTITPERSVKVDELTVVVALPQRHALYFNSPWATRYANPLEYHGLIDRDGWEWKHRFVPSLSLRDNDRGLDWACESDEGWQPYDRPDTLRVTRRAGRVTLEIAVLGKTRLEKGRPLRFSMMLEALPVRPLSGDYHRRHLIHFQGGPDKDGQTWQVAGFGRTSYPIRGIAKAAAMGVNALTFHELWSDGFGRPIAHEPQDFKRVVQYAHKLGMKVIVYYGAGFWADSPEYQTYHWDWDALPRKGEVEGAKQAAPGRSDMRYIGLCPRGNHYLDYLAWGLTRIIEQYGIDGVYIDGGEAFPCANEGHGCGYVDQATGRRRPTWAVLASRRQRKRFYTILHGGDRRGLIEQHLPYGQTAPIHAFTDTYLAGEPLAHHIGPEHAIPSAWMRQEFTGRQFGLPAEILVYRNNLIDKYLASALVHGAYPRALASDYVYLPGADLIDRMSRVWKAADEFGLDRATFRPYWSNADLVRSTPDEIKVSLYQHPGHGVLAVVANLGGKQAEAKLKLDLAGLGLPKGGIEVRDCLPAAGPPRLDGDELMLTMKPQTVRLVRMRSRSTP